MYFDKVNLHLWKKIQDTFSEEINLSIFTLDREGEEIVVSGKSHFLMALIASKGQGLLKKRHYGQINDLEEQEIALYNCFGAVYIAVAVFLHEKKIGAVLAGPIASREYDYEEPAKEMGLEESELLDAANTITVLSQEKIDLYRKMISLFVSLAPQLTSQRKSRDDKISELTALHSISKMINSTLELEEILKYIMNFLVSSLQAIDCSVFVHEQEGEKKYFLRQGVQDMTSVEKAVAKRAEEEKRPITVKNISLRFGMEVPKDYNALLSVPLKLKDTIIGSINLYGSFVHSLKQEQIQFVSTMANQVAIAISNAQRYSEVKELAVNDKLTGVFNRRHFMELLEKKIEKGITFEHPVSLILLDIDSFGKYNNAHGHQKGDYLLKTLCGILKEHVREEDIIGRYGGEEFILFLPELKSNDAMDVAKKINQAVANHVFEGAESQPGRKVTISVGLVSCMDTVPLSDLVKEADDALYKAKNSGKNKVVQRIILKNNLRTEMSS